MVTRRFALIVVALLAAASAAGTAEAANPRVLVFTKTEGYRHESIPAAIQAVRDLGTKNGFDVTATEDDTVFSAAGLAPYDAVIFLLTSGDVLSEPGQTAFETWFRAGHGYVGVHSATDTERGWPWYGRMLGTWSSGHPEIQPGVLQVVTPTTASTAALPARWARTDEWYGWQTNPRANGVRVLLTVDESTYLPRDWAMGADHPMAWEHEFEGGRGWYTQNGHTTESYSEPLFLGHLLGGIQYAVAKPTGSDPTPAAKPKASPPGIGVDKVGKGGAKHIISTSVKARRVSVRVMYSQCKPCRASMLIRSRATKLKLTGIPDCATNVKCVAQVGLATGTSAVLPPGRWRMTLLFTDAGTGMSSTVSRWVRIPKAEA